MNVGKRSRAGAVSAYDSGSRDVRANHLSALGLFRTVANNLSRTVNSRSHFDRDAAASDREAPLTLSERAEHY